ncbi:hypothetical protein A9W98_18010 [Mycobacterium gordonae]|uniref:Uncharacterized protein n=1 Tax=Mycobacterium gordonae TaxID=1778 RepID=A0A1A6BHS8_MYCGO|nr:hypothetical protein [Mycobacterium gordonae]OBS01878.1 hypothetical protein A9W98_18010 [Mycobacterium gordonae]
MTTDHRQTAALALAKCAAYDPWFPKASQAIVDSWAEQIERYELARADVLAGVTKMYSDNGSGFRPLPKDLTDAARAVRRERTERESDAERRAREDVRDAQLENRNRLAGMVGGLAEAKAVDRA